MFCINCGMKIPEGASACPRCGTETVTISEAAAAFSEMPVKYGGAQRPRAGLYARSEAPFIDAEENFRPVRRPDRQPQRPRRMIRKYEDNETIPGESAAEKPADAPVLKDGADPVQPAGASGRGENQIPGFRGADDPFMNLPYGSGGGLKYRGHLLDREAASRRVEEKIAFYRAERKHRVAMACVLTVLAILLAGAVGLETYTLVSIHSTDSYSHVSP